MGVIPKKAFELMWITESVRIIWNWDVGSAFKVRIVWDSTRKEIVR
jgi:hypothetical protein